MVPTACQLTGVHTLCRANPIDRVGTLAPWAVGTGWQQLARRLARRNAPIAFARERRRAA